MIKQGHEEETGRAKITSAHNLPCRYVILTVGPIISGPVTKADKKLLASCYQSCLELAGQNGVKSIAFCCISTGEFHFPNDKAAEIAVKTIKKYNNQIFELVKNKDYFVITTNVEHCFQKAGFDKKRLFYTQGDYGLFQCSEPCCLETFENEDTIRQMTAANPKAVYACVNYGEAACPHEIEKQSICIDGDIDRVLQQIIG